jgi:glycine C-acetyltransferase
MADESHSAGVVGTSGRGVTELYDIRGRLDLITGTLGKAFGGAVGGFATGRREIIDWLRQRSRPYLFSNSLPPMIVAGAIRTFELLERDSSLHERLAANTRLFVDGLRGAGFDVRPTQSAICAVMLYDARLAGEFSERLLEEGVYVIGFSFPVVPEGQARIRVQVSAAHSRRHIERALEVFSRIGRRLGVLK